MSFLQNCCKPRGLGGWLMVRMMNRGHEPMAAWGFSHLAVPADASCLDIGCGGGANVRRLLELAPEGQVKAIDYSPVSVRRTARLNRRAVRAGRCEVLEGDVMDLPFADGSFDVVSACETVYFWPSIEGAFRQVRRVLKPDGRFLMINGACGEREIEEVWKSKIRGMVVYRPAELETALRNAGFAQVSLDMNDEKWLSVVATK